MNKGLLILIFILTGHFAMSKSGDLERFFTALKSKSETKIDDAIAYFNGNSDNHKAYVAALMMKKAGVVKNAAEKLKLFKAGKNQLETLISKQPDNLEWRFLRLAIQENAPDMLGYNDAIENDTEFIYSNFSSGSSELQQVIKQYASKSEILETSHL